MHNFSQQNGKECLKVAAVLHWNVLRSVTSANHLFVETRAVEPEPKFPAPAAPSESFGLRLHSRGWNWACEREVGGGACLYLQTEKFTSAV